MRKLPCECRLGGLCRHCHIDLLRPWKHCNYLICLLLKLQQTICILFRILSQPKQKYAKLIALKSKVAKCFHRWSKNNVMGFFLSFIYHIFDWTCWCCQLQTEWNLQYDQNMFQPWTSIYNNIWNMLWIFFVFIPLQGLHQLPNLSQNHMKLYLSRNQDQWSETMPSTHLFVMF